MTMHDDGGARAIRLDIAGTTLAATRSGTGPAILCLHAIAHGARDYARLAERLGHRFTFVALDFPGHGESPAEAQAPTAARYAELATAAADALGLRRFALLGCSFGAAAAIRIAAANPERVTALVICNSSGLQPIGLLARIVCARYASFFARGERGDKRYAREFARYYRTVLPSPMAAWRRDEIVADAYKTAGILRAGWQEFAKPESDIRPLMPRLACPVFYAWAKRDRINAWSRSRRAALSAPHHRVAMFDGGHAAFLEAPDAFEAALLEFMADIPA